MIFVTVILISGSYIYGWLKQPSGGLFNGLHGLAPVDYNVYYSYVEQVKAGQYFFRDLYTNETQPYSYFNIFWLIVGLLAKFLNLSSILAFHLTRIILAVVFIFVIWKIIIYFIKDQLWQKISLVFILFSSGVGGYLSPILEKLLPRSLDFYQYNPVDVWVPEANTFLILYQTPHFIASLIFMLLIFYFTLRVLAEDKTQFSIFAGLSALILFQFHPFYIVTIFGILMCYSLVTILYKLVDIKKTIKHLFILGVFSSPSIFYYFWLMKYDWLTQERARQNLTISPNFFAIIIGYGFIFFLALLGLYFFYKKRSYDNKNIFLTVWFVVQTLLIYLPVNFQRRLLEGYHIVLVLLSIYGLIWLVDLLKTNYQQSVAWSWLQNKYFLVTIFFIFFLFSNIFNITRDFILFKKQYPFFYVSQADYQSLNWLKKNLNNTDSVLASNLLISNFIPGFTGKTSYIGHGVETAGFEKKLLTTQVFFNSKSNLWRKPDFFKENNITHLYYNTSDYPDLLPKLKGVDYLDEVYKNEGVIIFKLKN